MEARKPPGYGEKGNQQGEHDGKGKPRLRPAGRQVREDEMLFLRDNGGCFNHRSDSLRRLGRAARSSHRLATLIPRYLGSPPFL
jgi:hypothetical protein